MKTETNPKDQAADTRPVRPVCALTKSQYHGLIVAAMMLSDYIEDKEECRQFFLSICQQYIVYALTNVAHVRCDFKTQGRWMEEWSEVSSLYISKEFPELRKEERAAMLYRTSEMVRTARLEVEETRNFLRQLKEERKKLHASDPTLDNKEDAD
ncbi:MAG: hypothetical protein LUE27_09980 [Clostridia bacterium]|nr:hypothetical protein [Clostridia bacterium]